MIHSQRRRPNRQSILRCVLVCNRCSKAPKPKHSPESKPPMN